MCSSWLPSASKSQESSFEISSIVRSLTANRPRLPGPITFKDEQGKSLCDIVSRLSLTIDDTKLLKQKSIDFFNKKNHDENSPIESTLKRKERVNLMISQALWSTKEPELIELYSGENEDEETDFSTESMKNLKNWGSIKSFASRGNESSGTFSGSIISQDQGPEIIDKLSERTLSLERNSSTSRLPENPDQNNEVPSEPTPSESKDMKKSCSRISFSGKNSRDKLKKKSSTRFSKRKSSHRVRGKRGKKRSSSSLVDNGSKSKLPETEKPQNSDEKLVSNVKHVDQPSPESPEPKRQRSKLELLKSRFASGLFPQQKATAKPSRTVIPQSSRARAIFRPLAGIQEPEESKKDSKKPLTEPPKPKNRITPRPSNPVWRPGGSPRGRAPFSRSPTTKTPEITPVPKDEPKSHILRSKTFVSKDPKIELSKKSIKNSEPLRILKEILAIKEESPKPSRIPTIKTSQSSLNSKTLIEKLAKSSDTSVSSIRSRSVVKKLYRTSHDFQSQTPKIVLKSQCLQTVPESKEQFDVFTETESIPVMNDAQVSCDTGEHEEKKMMDTGVSCALSVASSNKNVELKLFRVIETQTSKSLICGGKKDVSLETLRFNFPCKEINTDKNVLIDSSTGKDKLEINNFSCDSQLTNTELFLYPSINSEGIDQVNIDIDDNSMNSIVSTISSELVSSRKCLIDSCKKFSTEFLQKHDEIIKIPEEVIRAFEIAAERAQNLYRAIEIYHEKISNNQVNSINSDSRRIENSDDSHETHCDLKRLMMQQEVQIVIEDIMNAVDEKLNVLNDKVSENRDSENSSKLLMKRGNILPIVYGALCSLVFWSLQFSMSCDLS